MCNNPVPFRNIQGRLYRQYSMNQNIADYMDKIQIPCGNCLGCRLDSLALWSARCNYELYKTRSAFVTFTYDDYHLPYKDDSALFPTLCRDDLHKFIDNLRHKVKKMPFLPQGNRSDFSYFATGEYGGKFQRPHYHVLFFGLDYMDFKRLFLNTWKQGLIESLPIMSGGVRYVVDYFTKEKVSGKLAEELYDNRALERPFTLSSRGLGSELFYDHRNEIRYGKPLMIGSRQVPVPAYYKNLYCSYSDDEVVSRLNFNRQHYDEIVREAKRLHFPSTDSYLSYIRKSNELALESRFRRDNASVMASYTELESRFDYQSLARSALM